MLFSAPEGKTFRRGVFYICVALFLTITFGANFWRFSVPEPTQATCGGEIMTADDVCRSSVVGNSGPTSTQFYTYSEMQQRVRDDWWWSQVWTVLAGLGVLVFAGIGGWLMKEGYKHAQIALAFARNPPRSRPLFGEGPRLSWEKPSSEQQRRNEER